MGQEARVEYVDGRDRVLVKAHLDSLNLQLSGGKKLTVSLSEVKTAVVEADLLKVATGKSNFALKLGARAAELWRKKILSPPSLGDKLGFKAGKSVTFIGGVPREIVEAAEGLHSGSAARVPTALRTDIAIVLLQPGKEAKLITSVSRALDPSAAAWLIYAKGGPVNGDDIIGLARRAGLKDTKVARVSETHAALRFIKAKA